MQKRIVVLSLFVGLVLIALFVNPNADSNHCIEPEYQIAYPYKRDPVSLDPFVPALSNAWDLIKTTDMQIGEFPFRGDLIVSNDGKSVWGISDENEIAKIEYAVGQEEIYKFDFYVEDIFKSNNGVIFTLGMALDSNNNISKIIVSKFNSETIEFEEVSTFSSAANGEFGPGFYISNLVRMSDDYYWFFMNEKLYRLGLTTNDLVEHPILEEILDHPYVQEWEVSFQNTMLVTDQDKNIFFVADVLPYPEAGYHTYIFFEFDTSQFNLKGRSTLPTEKAVRNGISHKHNLYYDPSGKIWINADLYYPLEGDENWWYKLVTSSDVFVSQNKILGLLDAIETTPAPKFMYGENQLWYSSGSGVVWLDTNTGDWCLVSTAPMRIVKIEDDIWGFYEKNIYHYRP